MTDPMERLYRPTSPADPRPEFVVALRNELIELLDVGASPLLAAPDPAPSSNLEPATVVEMNSLVGPTTSIRSKRRRRAAVLAAAAIIVAVVAAGVVSRRGDDNSKINTTPSTTIQVTPTTSDAAPTTGSEATSDLPSVQTFAQVRAQTFTTAGSPLPWLQTVVGDSLWISYQNGGIERRDKRTGALLATLPVQVGPVAATPVAAFGSLWIAVANRAVVVRIDLTTTKVTAEIQIPGGLTTGNGADYLSDLAVAADGVWTLTASPNRNLVRIDPTTNTVAQTLPIGNATDVAYGAGSLWVAAPGYVSRVSPTDGAEIARIETPLTGALVKFFAGQVWVAGDTAGRRTLAHVDPSSNRVVAQFPVSNTFRGEIDLAYGGGFVWIGTTEASLAKIDPITNTVVARIGELAFNGVSADDDVVWVSTGNQLVALLLK